MGEQIEMASSRNLRKEKTFLELILSEKNSFYEVSIELVEESLILNGIECKEVPLLKLISIANLYFITHLINYAAQRLDCHNKSCQNTIRSNFPSNDIKTVENSRAEIPRGKSS